MMKYTRTFIGLLFCLLLLNACQKDSLTQAEQIAPGFDFEQVDKEMQAEMAEMANEPEIEEITDLLKSWDGASPRAGFTLIPSGSVDQLQQAIQDAPINGLIVLDNGTHTENATILIEKQIRIVGRTGAVLRINNAPQQFGEPMEPGIHILNAHRVIIHNIEMVPTGADGGTAILIENGDYANVNKCAIKGFQYGIINHLGDQIKLKHNTIASTTGWLSGAFPGALGITNVNGVRAEVYNNEVTNSQFGIWACDRDGRAYKNYVSNNYIGIILCKVPAGGVDMPDGSTVGSARAGSNWRVRTNKAMNNFDAGIIIIDGANNNVVGYNNSKNNGTYDIEAVGDSYRFGFLTPKSYDNWIVAVNGQSVKDCGENNKVTGGDLVNNAVDPCF